jgi:hypothetical protein
LLTVVPTTSTSPGLYRFTDEYLARCRTLRLKRWPERLGRDAQRLERGDLYAWPEGLAPTPGAIHVSLLAEPRPLWTTDRIWWIPRLEQLLERMERAALRRHGDLTRQEAREEIARQLAALVLKGEGSWEEITLDLMLERESRDR